MNRTTTIPFVRYLTTKALLPWYPFSSILKLLQNTPPFYHDLFSGVIASVEGCIKRVKKGDRDARILCGVLYWKGIDVKKDVTQALRYLSEDASQKDYTSLYLRSQILLSIAENVEQREEALTLMVDCAANKIENAIRLLAFYSAYGIYCDRSPGKAREEMKKAAALYEDIHKKATAYINALFNTDNATENLTIARSLARKAKLFAEALMKLRDGIEGESGANQYCLPALSAGLWEARFPLATYYSKHGDLSTPSEIASLYEKDAQLGLNPLADFRLGCMFVEGKGVAQSNMIAYVRIQKAAKLGIDEAQKYLNDMPQPAAGSGRVSSKELSVRYYTKLREEGEAQATYYLALVNLFGLEGFDNADRAVHYFYESALSGCAEALVYLSHITCVGYTISKDEVLSAEYMERAKKIGFNRENLFPECILKEPTNDREGAIRALANNGDVGAQFVLAILIHLRLVDGTYHDMVSWIEKSSSNNPSAQYRLACMYLNAKQNDDEARADPRIQLLIDKASAAGHLGAIFLHSICALRDKSQEGQKKARELIAEAAEKGFSRAQHLLGTFYLGDRFFPHDEKKALAYIQAAADGDCPEAMYDMAYFVERDSKDMAYAIRLTERSAELGYRKAQLAIGQYYLEDPGSVANKEHGAIWAEAWAAVGPNETKFLLAKSYDRGEGFPKDPEKALRWFQEIKEGPYSAMSLAYVGKLTLAENGFDGVFRSALPFLFTELKESDSLDMVRSAAERDREPYTMIQGVLSYLETKNAEDAVPWLQKCKGQKIAQYILSEIYTHGSRGGRDLENAFLALGGIIGNQFKSVERILASIYVKDVRRREKMEKSCGEKNILRYLKCSIRDTQYAADSGVREAECALGMRYCLGLDIPVNLAKAYCWFERAATKGCVTAVCYASIMGRNGIGTLVDEEQSYALLEQFAHSEMTSSS